MPTYGKTGVGASWVTAEIRYVVRTITLPGGESVVGFNAYLRSQGSATGGWRLALYDKTDDSLDYQSNNMAGFTDTVGAWRTATYSAANPIADTYWLVVAAEVIAGGANTIQVAFDTITLDAANYQFLAYTGTWPTLQNPLPIADDIAGSGTHDVSIYLETAASGATIAIPLGSLTLAGSAQALSFLTPIGTGALLAQGHAVTISQQATIGIASGTLLFSGFSQTLRVQTEIGVGSLLFTGSIGSLNSRLNLGSTASLTLTGSPLALSAALSVGAGALLITGYGSTQSNEIDFGVVAGLTLSGFAPTPALGAQSISIGRGVMSLTGFSQTFSISIGIGKFDILATGFAPSLSASIPISVGALSISGFTTTLSQSASDISIGRGQLSVLGYAPSPSVDLPIVEIGLGVLSLSGYATTLSQLLLIRQADKREDVTLVVTRPDSTTFSSRSDNTLSSKRLST